MSFVQEANLPEDTAGVLIGEDYTEILQSSLEKCGVLCLSVPSNPNLDPRLRSHADLSVLHLGGNRLLLADCLRDSALAADLEGKGAALSFLPERQKAAYPGDAGLNLCLMGERVIANPKTAAPQALQAALPGRTLLSTRQGYSRCSVCVLDRDSLITADARIAAAAERAGLHVLRILPGGIRLAGYSSGFLGVAAFKLSKRKIAFTGHLEDHPDQNAILRFLESRGLEAVFLSDEPIFDIGSAVPILEK